MYPMIAHTPWDAGVQRLNELVAERTDAQAEFLRLRGTQLAPADFLGGRSRYLDGELTKAIQADDDARGEALMLNRKDPGPKSTKAIEDKIKTAHDRVRVLDQAISRQHGELHRIITSDAAAIADAADADIDQRKQRILALAADLAEEWAAYFRARRVKAWFTRREVDGDGTLRKFRGANAMPPGLNVPGLAPVHSAPPLQLGQALDAARDLLAPPEPERKVAYYEQRREVLKTPGGVPEGVVRRSVPVYADEVPAAVPPGLNVGGVPFFPDLGGSDDE